MAKSKRAASVRNRPSVSVAPKVVERIVERIVEKPVFDFPEMRHPPVALFTDNLYQAFCRERPTATKEEFFEALVGLAWKTSLSTYTSRMARQLADYFERIEKGWTP